MQQQQLQYFKRIRYIEEVILKDELEGFNFNHPADSGSELAMNTTEFLMQDYINDNEGKIEAALAAIDEGSYGICKVCQKEIPHERLEMMPTSLTCMNPADAAPLQ